MDALLSKEELADENERKGRHTIGHPPSVKIRHSAICPMELAVGVKAVSAANAPGGPHDPLNAGPIR